jgi:preprotein translocase subunit SecE
MLNADNVTNSSTLVVLIAGEADVWEKQLRKSGVVLNKYSLALILEEMMMRVKHPTRRLLTTPAFMIILLNVCFFGFFFFLVTSS